MLKFHWMARYGVNSVDAIRQMTITLEKAGYESALMVYGEREPDLMLWCLRALDINQKLKYMIAIRPHSVSPEYFYRQYRSCDDIAINRFIFNIVPGQIDEFETMKSHVFIKDLIDTSEKRSFYKKIWVDNVNASLPKIPDLYISGNTKESIDLSLKYNHTHVSTLNTYMYHFEKKNIVMGGKYMVAVQLIIRYKQEDIDWFNSILTENEKAYTFVGSKEDLFIKIKDLEKYLVTDVMIYCHPSDNKVDEIHALVRNLKGSQ